MIKDPGTTWIGMEYFCTKTDDFWALPDDAIQRIAIEELEKMELARVEDVMDITVRRMEKTYPAYFGTYKQFDTIKDYVNQFENLFLVGRNGMHKYNNADHSMLTAMVSVDNICAGVTGKENIWAINTEQEYHEVKKQEETPAAQSMPAPKQQVHMPQMDLSFKHFLFRTNKKLLWFGVAAWALQFIVFKYFYPYASFIHDDSFVYLTMAYLNKSIDTYPFGYPMFLRLFSVFSNSDTLLVTVQFLLLQCASLLFFFTVIYFFRIGRFTKYLLFAFSIANPVYLYLANTIGSDALFTALSISWFTVLVWIIQKPSIRLILLQILLLYLTFVIRNNALYYPLITVLAIILSKQRIVYKTLAIAGSFFVIGLYVLSISSEFYKLTGIRQFAPFSGWQMANNALYAYRYVDSADRKPVPKKFQELDGMVRNYFDTTRNILKYPHELALANTYYMWNKFSPLQIYAYRKLEIDTSGLPLKTWASVAPLYYSYGKLLIQQYPDLYLRWYLGPNAAKFYAPPVEFLENYNMGTDTVKLLAKFWFKYKSTRVFTRLKDFKVTALKYNPILTGCLNGIFLISLLFFGMLKGFANNKTASTWLWLTATFWLVNFCFSVLAAPVSLRFQVFPTLVVFVSAVFMIEYICLAAFKPSLFEKPLFNPGSNLSVTS